MKPYLTHFILPLLISTAALFSGSRDLTMEVDLRGSWRFEIGNIKRNSDPGINDTHWEKIHVPGNWEDQGFPGYDGYAWYRIRFDISSKLSNATLYLDLGFVDDADCVYLNGHFVNGSGGFPPDFQTAWDRHRLYLIPNEYFNFGGANCLAVQVYDDEAEGGIRKGDIGIYSKKQPYELALNLAGTWKFKPGDNPEWSQPDYKDESWSDMKVPGKWEHYGFSDLDGFAWYRKSFSLPEQLAGNRWILMLGRIDDIDEIYLNGVKIGQTGIFPERTDLFIMTAYGKLRLYSVPPSLIKHERANTIAVRIFDKGGEGGIYEGPVGLISRKTYMRKKSYFQ